MSKRLLAILALVAVLGWCAPALMADHEDNDQGWERRDGYEYRTYDQHLPGWSHGKKTGWGNCGLPPGQAKKYGCQTYVYQGRPYYYYQDDVGRIVVRRPIIEIHGSLDIH